MRQFAFTSLFVLTVVAIPLAIEMGSGKHLQKRGTDSVIADVVKALLAFGAFIWGGEIISRRAVNYYFQKKAEIEKEKMKHESRKNATTIKVWPQPDPSLIEGI